MHTSSLVYDLHDLVLMSV